MTLEDFFTLTEMKDGLTAPARVKELITAMKKETDCIVKNMGDATRHWSAVSSTIAATDNKDCLDLFIQLDGLLFIDRWLKDAQKFDADTSESFVEEAITAMLGALEKLYIDNDRSNSSGISMTVKNLMDHSSLRIQDRARALCDRWKQDKSGNDYTFDQDAKKVEGSHDDLMTDSEKLTLGSKPESSALDVLLPKDGAKEENCSVEPMTDEVFVSKRSGGLQSENVEDSHRHAHDNHLNSAIDDRGPLPSFQEITSSTEEPQVSTKERTISVESSISAPEQQNVGQGDDHNLTVCTKDKSYCPDRSDASELSAGVTVLESRIVQFGDQMANAQESTGKPVLQNNSGVNQVERVTPQSETGSGADDTGVPCSSNTCLSNTASPKAESCTFLQKQSDKEHILVVPMDAETLVSKMKDCDSSIRKEAIPCLDAESLDEDVRSTLKFSKSMMNAISPDFTDKRKPDIKYGIVDVLDGPRKVAREAAIEVVDYREPSCSSSSVKASEGGIVQLGGSASINGKEDQTVSGPPEPSRQNLSAGEYLRGGHHAMKSDCVDTEPEICLPYTEFSHVTATVQESEANPEGGGVCAFDLNQEICTDDMDVPLETISTPISVVSASGQTVSPGLPAAPLQFESSLGWKESVLTNSFYPASPHRTSDGDGGNSGSKCRQDCLDFDLNVAEDGEDKFAKQTNAPFGHPSGELSIEVNSKKPDKFELDLNCIGDDADTPSADIRIEGLLFLHQNGHHNMSPASSSTSMQAKRNIDLNDRPYIQNNPFQQGFCHANLLQNLNADWGTNPDDPVISIMGTRVEVKRRDFVPQTLSLSNGKAPEFAMDANAARTAAFLGMGPTVSYMHPPAFGHNGFTTEPRMSFSSDMSVAYTGDSRVAPHMVGSASALPFMTSTPPGRRNLDLNTGVMIDGGNREASSLRQFLVSGEGRSMDNSVASVGTKRKEPEYGWEALSLNYKKHPWK